MRTTKVTDVLTAAGLRQRLYSEPTLVEEFCGGELAWCRYEADCCPGYTCNWDHGGLCYSKA